MSRWPTKPLGEVCELINGRAFKPDEWQDEGLPIIRIQNLNDPTKPFNYTKQSLPEKFRVKRGDTLLSWSGTPGTSFGCFRWDGQEGWLNQHIFKVRLNNGVLPAFFIHQVNSKLNELIRKAHGGVGLQHITKGALSSVMVAVPPLAEQMRIVQLLDEANVLRKLRAQADRRTASIIPSVFQEMFPPSRRRPAERLESLCQRITVGHVGPMASEYCETGIPFLRGQNIKRGLIDLSSVLFVSTAFHRRLKKSSITPGDIVSVRTGKPGTTAVVPPTLKIANCADLIVMTCGPRLDPEFLAELLNMRLGDEEKIPGATGIAQQHFNIGEARRLELFVPSLPLQKEFAKRVAIIRELEAKQTASRERIDALFQSMLHRAFHGEL